ncbi:MAG TPA: hypothetical protein VM554_15540 [Acidisarcina sp.]|nr:hypothetical protein [Acidisarcina sp.]
MGTSKRYVLAFDIHYPEHDDLSWRCVLDYTRKNDIDGFIFGGDQLDLACISHHTASQPLYRPQGALRSNLDGFKKYILDPVDAALKPGTDKRFLMGNHEAWLTEQYKETNPELDGLLDLPDLLGLAERKYEVIQQGGHTQIGKLYVIHGDTIGGGVNHAKKCVDVWARSVVYGHHHTLQSYTRTSPAHESERWTAISLPCLSHTAPRYGRGRSNMWVNGFGVVDVRSGGAFNVNPVIITDGTCSLEGKTYTGKRSHHKRGA